MRLVTLRQQRNWAASYISHQTPASEQGGTVALNTLHSHLSGFENTGCSASYGTHQLAKLHEDNLVPRYTEERWLSFSVGDTI